MGVLCFESVNKLEGNNMCEYVLEGGALCILFVLGSGSAQRFISANVFWMDDCSAANVERNDE